MRQSKTLKSVLSDIQTLGMSGSFQKGGFDSVVVRMLCISDVTLLVFDAVVSF